MGTVIRLGIPILITAIAGVLISLAFRSNTFVIQEVVNVRASEAAIWQELSDLKRWPNWIAGADESEKVAFSFTHDQSGTTDSFYWWGGQINHGRLKIVDRREHSAFRFKLTFLDWRASHEGFLTLSAKPDGTTDVAVLIRGRLRFNRKVLWSLLNCSERLRVRVAASLRSFADDLSQPTVHDPRNDLPIAH